MKKILATVGLLFCSNLFMNTAWYGHLKFKDAGLPIVIVASWGIAFFEYCFQVPANRIGSDVMTLTQLKVTQEALTLVTFAIFSAVVFGQKFGINQVISFTLIIAACFFAFK
jgi:uncharacterized protein (DUF486 family)